jgi:hypothetical protein
MKSVLTYCFLLPQFEDFQNKWALKLLQKYRTEYRMFNDDVQVNLVPLLVCLNMELERRCLTDESATARGGASVARGWLLGFEFHYLFDHACSSESGKDMT